MWNSHLSSTVLLDWSNNNLVDANTTKKSLNFKKKKFGALDQRPLKLQRSLIRPINQNNNFYLDTVGRDYNHVLYDNLLSYKTFLTLTKWALETRNGLWHLLKIASTFTA